ncbi:glycosyltransferase family 4 protein [Desulfovibrio sp. ZJ200]|uniref:glycosyltransferase family 4 protein n=1 Tax=Desulfovibrio sp. ZJ200 TaxID=2709792 RepID=UPI0013EA0276|nr:glycosyltransferase family 4 protein [Desulfovibrio sp. ZJ200]
MVLREKRLSSISEKVEKLHIVLLGLYEHDAIGSFTLSVASRARAAGVGCAIYAQDHSPSLRVDGTYEDFFSAVEPGDVLLYTLSNDDQQLPRLMESPCYRVIYYHNITPGRFFRPYDTGIADMLDRGRASLPLVSRANAVFANSAWSLEELLPHMAPEARRGVMPPLTPAMFERLAQRSHTGEATAAFPVPYVLTLGRLVPHKNIAWGLKFFAALHARMPSLTYAIVGGDGGVGAYAQELTRLASTLGDAQRNIHFIGEVSDAEALAWLDNAQALLCVSRHEGFGVPLVEGMMKGIPVLALSQPAVNETLGNGGLILEDEDMERNARRVAALLRSPKRLDALRLRQHARCQTLKTCALNNDFWETVLPKRIFPAGGETHECLPGN